MREHGPRYPDEVSEEPVVRETVEGRAEAHLEPPQHPHHEHGRERGERQHHAVDRPALLHHAAVEHGQARHAHQPDQRRGGDLPGSVSCVEPTGCFDWQLDLLVLGLAVEALATPTCAECRHGSPRNHVPTSSKWMGALDIGISGRDYQGFLGAACGGVLGAGSAGHPCRAARAMRCRDHPGGHGCPPARPHGRRRRRPQNYEPTANPALRHCTASVCAACGVYAPGRVDRPAGLARGGAALVDLLGPDRARDVRVDAAVSRAWAGRSERDDQHDRERGDHAEHAADHPLLALGQAVHRGSVGREDQHARSVGRAVCHDRRACSSSRCTSTSISTSSATSRRPTSTTWRWRSARSPAGPACPGRASRC